METDWLRIYLQVIPLTALVLCVLIIAAVAGIWLVWAFITALFRLCTRDVHPITRYEEID